jgi:succinate-semialdehyde dehydrogenase / glutarate-semialdehyde dehydrogenase
MRRVRLGITLASIDPMTGDVVSRWDADDPAAVNAAIELAHRRHLEWRRTAFADRSKVVAGLADALVARRDELAQLMAREMGKPVTQGRAEIDKCALACRWYAEGAEAMLADRPIATEHTRSFVHHEPLGVVLAVMPWNFPFWQVIRFGAPALMAGNAGVLKHASNVTGCALALGDLVEEAGAPDGLFGILKLPSDRVAEVIGHPLVRAVTVTGSPAAGRAVAAEAGRHLKKTVLELGGSDPYVVLADADVAAAARICAQSRLINGGQSCIAAKRFVTVPAIHDEFLEAFTAALVGARAGDPCDPATELGPLARHDLRDELHDQVGRSRAGGARLVAGGRVPDGPGAFYPPTVLTDVGPGTPAHDDELFGPVAAVLAARDEADAVRRANETSFGLGAAVFTRDLARGEELAARHLDAGSCFVNGLVASDPRLPFGGIGGSGYGRELGDIGLREFVNVKTVVVDAA